MNNTTMTTLLTFRALRDELKAAWHDAYTLGYAPEQVSARDILLTWDTLSDDQPTPIGKPLCIAFTRGPLPQQRPALLISAEAIRALPYDAERAAHLAEAITTLAAAGAAGHKQPTRLVLAIEHAGQVRYVRPIAQQRSEDGGDGGSSASGAEGVA